MPGSGSGADSPGGRCSRREFLRAGTVAAGGALLSLGPVAALAARPVLGRADDVLRIGLVVPDDAGGQAMTRGVQLGQEEAEHTAQLFNKRVELVSAAAGADPAAAAERLVREHGVVALVGGTDQPSALALADAADRLHVLFFDIGSSADDLRGRDCRRLAFHIDASAAMRADAVADWLTGPGAARHWYFLHPPTAAGHALWGRARAALGQRGGKQAGDADVAPDMTDLRPLLRDAQKEGADAVFASLTGTQQRTLMAQYRELAPPFKLAGPFLDTAALRALPAAQRAGVWPTLWYYERKPFGAGSLSGRYLDRFGLPMDAPAWAGWVALKILWEASLRARSSDPAALAAFLVSDHAEFDGHKGVPLSFRPWDHQLRQPLYLLGPSAQPADANDIFDVVMEVPRNRPGETLGTVALLDRLGDGPDNSECHAVAPGAPGAPSPPPQETP